MMLKQHYLSLSLILGMLTTPLTDVASATTVAQTSFNIPEVLNYNPEPDSSVKQLIIPLAIALGGLSFLAVAGYWLDQRSRWSKYERQKSLSLHPQPTFAKEYQALSTRIEQLEKKNSELEGIVNRQVNEMRQLEVQSISLEKVTFQPIPASPKTETNNPAEIVEPVNMKSLNELRISDANVQPIQIVEPVNMKSPRLRPKRKKSDQTNSKPISQDSQPLCAEGIVSDRSDPDWLPMYHENPDQLSDFLRDGEAKRILIVDLTPASAEQYFQGRLNHPPQFEQQFNGKYWIITGWIAADGKRFDYLVPKANFPLKNMHNVESIRTYFDCNDLDDAHAKIKVIQPGVVAPLDNVAQWQLEKRGHLQFESSQQVENDA